MNTIWLIRPLHFLLLLLLLLPHTHTLHSSLKNSQRKNKQTNKACFSLSLSLSLFIILISPLTRPSKLFLHHKPQHYHYTSSSIRKILMDHWDNDNHRLRNRKDHRHPSFSSTLLDQIYRSIDDSNSDVSMKTLKQQQQQQHHRVIAGDFVRCKNPKIAEPVFFKHSSSSSSDSSGFSSSESDSFYKRSRSENFHHPKPIRTTVVVEKSPQISHHRPNNKQEHGSFLRTKSKALKIYSDLKKVKQPISPGGRLSTFLNSIFTGKPNKINTTTVAAVASSTTTCSSASSFSRSCLSKTPSSSEKSKRSVRFLDESTHNNNERESNRNNRFIDECQNDKNKLYGNHERESNRNNQNLEIRVMEENRRVIEAAKELLRNYQKNKDVVVKISGEEEEEEEEDDDDDAASCASSDLFELDNLSAIGIGKYREELPVYETTRLNTNRR